jgi:ZIP family zinc transporter
MTGLAEPVGALFGMLFLLPFWTPTVGALLLAAVAGIMVYISFDELLPGAEEYGHHHFAIGGVILGMAIMAFSFLLF